MSAHTIAGVTARRVWDSRGRPTVEAEIRLADGAIGRAIAPAGASTGSGEALDLRDGGAAFGGYGVATALTNLGGPIDAAIRGLDAADQRAVDDALIACDTTPNKSRLGANAMIAASMATAHAAAAAAAVPLWRYLADGADPVLPLPEIQIFGGGAHAGGRVDVQDFMIMVPGAATLDQALAVSAEVYRAAGLLMAEQGRLAGVADEGGWWPAFDGTTQALDTLMQAIERTGERPGDRVAISLDIAASQFGAAGRYRLRHEGVALDRAGWLDTLAGWLGRYPIVALEDPFAEDDADGWAACAAAVGDKVQLIGDDYVVTDAARIAAAAAAGHCNAALIKPNQAGTLSEARDALEAARGAGWRTIVSARSGESEDVTIAHLAVGWSAGQIKVGSFARSERMAKWNELLRIAEALGPSARFAGAAPLGDTWWGRR